MQALQAVMLAGRVGTLRSAQLPRPMAAVVVGLVRVLLCQVRGGAEAANVRRVPLRPHRVQMVEAVVVVALRLLVSMPQAAAVVAAVAPQLD